MMSFSIVESVQFNKTEIPGVIVIEPRVFSDERGYFFESYNSEVFAKGGITDVFVQDNEAKSQRGVLRGLHYQVGAAAQSKLVRVTRGSVFDIAVDIREGSKTYGRWIGVELSAENKKQLYLPRGFAHGYLALEDDTILCYKCDNTYSREDEGGIRYDDPTLDIRWPVDRLTPIISTKDLALPAFGKHLRP